MTIRRPRWLTSLSLLAAFAACGVDDLDVKGKNAGGSAGSGSSAEGGEDTGSGGAVNGSGGASAGNTATGGDGDTGMGGENGSTNAGMDGGGSAGAPGGSGGTPNGGSGGSAGGPTKPACMTGALANVLFCDDFETDALPAWTHFAPNGSDGETVRVSGPVHLGSAAIRSIKSATGSRDPLVADVLGMRSSGKLYVRVWMYIASTVTITNQAGANASLLVLGQAPPSDGGVSLALWTAGATLQVYDPNHNPTLVQTAAYDTTLPRDAWFCLRMDFPIGTSVSSTDFHLRIGNSAPVNNEPAKTVDSALSSPYDRVWIGVNYISPQQTSAVTVHYDDIAVDTADIPCQ
jgi:hypothetical protein